MRKSPSYRMFQHVALFLAVAPIFIDPAVARTPFAGHEQRFGSKPAATAVAPAARSAETIGTLLAAGDDAGARGNLDQALLHYVQALEAAPSSEAAHLRVAEAHYALGNFDIASSAFQQVLKLRPASAPAAQGLGLVLLRQGRLVEAHRALDQALSADASLWRARNGLGVIADRQGRSGEAMALYHAALTSQPSSALILNNMGYSSYLAGDLGRAQQYFGRAILAEPRNAEAWSNMGLVHARQGDFARAVSAFRELMPEAQAYYSTAYICLLGQRYEEAERLFLQAMEASPTFYPEARAGLKHAQRALLPPADRPPPLPQGPVGG